MKLYVSKVSHEVPVDEIKVKRKRNKKVQEETPSVEEIKEEPVVEEPVVEEPEIVVTTNTPEETLVEEPLETIKEEEKIVEEPEPKVKKERKKRIVEPPKWFKTFISNTKINEEKVYKQKIEKKPRKVIKKEAMDYAHDQWQDRFVRDSFTNQGEKHLDQLNHLYGQIFKR
jgi:hypothetical protein